MRHPVYARRLGRAGTASVIHATLEARPPTILTQRTLEFGGHFNCFPAVGDDSCDHVHEKFGDGASFALASVASNHWVARGPQPDTTAPPAQRQTAASQRANRLRWQLVGRAKRSTVVSDLLRSDSDESPRSCLHGRRRQADRHSPAHSVPRDCGGGVRERLGPHH